MSTSRESNKERLFKAAATLFSQRGFDAVSTRDLCTKARVNVAAISYYFGGKEGLFLQVFREYAQRLADRMDLLISQCQQAQEQEADGRSVPVSRILRVFIVGFIELRLQEPEVAIVLQGQGLHKIPGVREAFQSTLEPVAQKLVAFFRELQSAGKIRGDLNIRSFLTIFIESIWGYFSLQERGEGLLQDAYRLPEDQELFVEFLTKIYTQGVQTPSVPGPVSAPLS